MSDVDQDQVEGIYQPKDAVGAAVKATGVTGVAGLFVSTIQNTLAKSNVGAFSVFTRTGGTIAIFGMLLCCDLQGKCHQVGRDSV